MIETVCKNIKTYKISDQVGKYGILKLTGPIAYTKALLPILNNYHCRIIESNLFIGLIYNNIGKSHIKLFKKHYSKLKSPLVLFK